MLDYGAMGAVMTGTGSAVFGIAQTASARPNAWKRLKTIFLSVFLEKPVKRIPESE